MQVLDNDGSGVLTFNELCSEIKLLVRFPPRVCRCAEENFDGKGCYNDVKVRTVGP